MKKIFLQLYDKDDKARYEKECVKKNIGYGKIYLTAISCFEVFMIIYSLVTTRLEDSFSKMYFACYCILLVASLFVLIFSFCYSKKEGYVARRFSIVIFCYAIIIILWSIAISVLDSKTSLESVVYLTVVMGISFGMTLPDGRIFPIIDIFSYVLFLLGVAFFSEYGLFLPEVINITVFFAIILIFNISKNNSNIRDFLQKKEIEEKNLRFHEANEKLYSDNIWLGQTMRRDALTGLLNRWTLEENLSEKFNYCQGASLPLSVCLFDIDDFKKINDTYGHEVGDQCLQRLGQILLTYEDRFSVFRFGGEEFLLASAGIPDKEVFFLIEEIRVKAFSERFSALLLPLTISGGISSCVPDDTMTTKDFLVNADSALYKAKATGKNRIVLYSKD